MKYANYLNLAGAFLLLGSFICPGAYSADYSHLEARSSDRLIDLLNREGVAIVRGAYPAEGVKKLFGQADSLVSTFMTQKHTLPFKAYDYTHVYDRVHPKFVLRYNFQDSKVLAISDDRYDFSPLNSSHIDVEVLSQPMIEEAMNKLIEGSVSSYLGILPSAPGSAEGVWHRDTMPFTDTYDKSNLASFTEEIERQNLRVQNYYFTVLIPLVDANAENGATIFQPRSHLWTYNQVMKAKLPTVQPSLKVGDAVVFAGTLFHQGAANHSEHNRLVAFQVWQNKDLFKRHHK